MIEGSKITAYQIIMFFYPLDNKKEGVKRIDHWPGEAHEWLNYK